MVERETSELSIKEQTDLLSLSRSSLYYTPRPPSPEEVEIKHRIDAIFTQSPFYGSRRIAVTLRQEGRVIGRNTVARYMREMGLQAIYPKPNLSASNLENRIYPYLLRGLKASHPNHIWGIDLTYIRCKGSWMYLVAILDWHSRYIVSWELAQTLEMPFVLSCVDSALAGAAPAILNSDQGSHFTSPQYTERLLAKQVSISMDGKGRALDNIFTERLWRTIKYEEVYLHEYESPREARQKLNKYLGFYNEKRPHQSLDYKTPKSVYQECQNNK